MQKIYLKLTKEQLDRGVVFSSTLSKSRTEAGFHTHEVFSTQPEAERERMIKRLKNDSFFDGLAKYNIIRS